MASIWVTRRDGSKCIRPRYMLERPQPLTEQDRRNIDALVEMYDEANAPPEDYPTAPDLCRKLQHITMEVVLRSLAHCGSGAQAQREWRQDVNWVRMDIGTPGLRLRDICDAFGWDYRQVRGRLLDVADQAREGRRRRVPSLSRKRARKELAA